MSGHCRGQGISLDDKTNDIGNALASEGKSPHLLDLIDSCGVAWSGLDLTTIGEVGRGHVSTSCQHHQCKTYESVAEEEVGGQCLPRVSPVDQGGKCGQEV